MFMYEATKVWIPKHLKEEARKLGINISRTARHALLRSIEKAGGESQDPGEVVAILAHCPFCGGYTQTSSIHIIRCKKCRQRFRVYTRRYGIRGKIMKGEEEVKKKIHVLERPSMV